MHSSRVRSLFTRRRLAFAVLAATSAGPVQAAVEVIEFPLCDYCSHVLDEVIDNQDGTWTYNFEVFNDDPGAYGYGYGSTRVVVDWELPWFADAGITNIQSAYGWEYAIETIGVANPDTGWNGIADWQTPGNPWYQGPDSPFTTGTQVLHWYTLSGEAFGIYPFGSLTGFSFTSPFPATNAPYQASWLDLVIRTGDPAFPGGTVGVPASPSLVAPVPLPAPFALLATAVATLAARTRPKASRAAS